MAARHAASLIKFCHFYRRVSLAGSLKNESPGRLVKRNYRTGSTTSDCLTPRVNSAIRFSSSILSSFLLFLTCTNFVPFSSLLLPFGNSPTQSLYLTVVSREFFLFFFFFFSSVSQAVNKFFFLASTYERRSSFQFLHKAEKAEKNISEIYLEGKLETLFLSNRWRNALNLNLRGFAPTT